MRHTPKELHTLPPDGSVKEPWQSRRLAHLGLGLLNQSHDPLPLFQPATNQSPGQSRNRNIWAPVYKKVLVS